MDPNPPITITPRAAVAVMGCIIGVLVIGHAVAAYIYRGVGQDAFPGATAVARLLNMDGETNVPTWYSVAALLFCAALAAIVAATAWRSTGSGRRWRWHWIALAALLAFLSLDDGALLHEELSRPLTRTLDLEASRWQFWAWLLPYSLLGLALVVAFWRFLLGLPAGTRNQIVLAGAVFVAGAAGMELVGRELFDPLDPDATYLLGVGVEEVLEMVGVVILTHALLSYLRDEVGPVSIAWSADAG